MDGQPVENDNETVTCHGCGSEYQRIGYHWSNGSCDHPVLTDRAEQLVEGMMLGDGTLRTHTTYPFVQIYMINKLFLEWLDNELGWLTTGVSLYRTAERSAELSRDNGYPGADVRDYHDVYSLQTRTMPAFRRYEDWYQGDGKRFPDDLVLTPTTTTIWYACDGSLNWDRRYPGSRPHATISVQSEMDNIDNVVRMFRKSSFEHDPTVDTSTIRFTVDETEDLIEWLDDAPPGFEYKWSLDSPSTYQDLKNEALGD